MVAGADFFSLQAATTSTAIATPKKCCEETKFLIRPLTPETGFHFENIVANSRSLLSTKSQSAKNATTKVMLRLGTQQERQSLMMPTLYIVPTPIGNLSDLSPRAREILSSVDFVTCEDTRHTAKLLTHFGITTPTASLHEHNEKERSQSLVQRLLDSPQKSAAIVTDAGTPCISDPGAYFVETAHANGVRIISLPGPSALTCTLAASGFLQPRQVFSAFLPRGTKEQIEEFSKWQLIAPCIAVFYESPQRILSTLKNLSTHFGANTQVCLSREISKIHEEHSRGFVSEILAIVEARSHSMGECAIAVNITPDLKTADLPKLTLEEAKLAVEREIALGARTKEAVKKIADANGIDTKTLYNLMHKS
jgi:16S rRNA (cytidine1402-2'-O)-methyltransferase